MKQTLPYAIAFAWSLCFASPAFAQIEFPQAIGDTIVLDTIPQLEIPEKQDISLQQKSLEKKLKELEKTIPLHYSRDVQAFINVFVNYRRDYVAGIAKRSEYYFPIFEAFLKKHNLPEELKYLAIVESALHPRAKSWASAVGLWQFIPSTGRYFHLRQDGFVDERMEPHQSTEAACIYLKELYQMYGDWELAMASYNCGPGYVNRAIRMSGNRTDFRQIYRHLPRETRSYVPMFVAIMYVMNTLEEHKIEKDTTTFLPLSDTLHINSPLSLPLLARQLAVDTGTLQALNPHLKLGLIPGYLKNCVLNIPKTSVDNFLVNRTEILDSVSKITYRQPVYVARQERKRTFRPPTYATASLFPSFSTEGKSQVTYIVKAGDVLENIAGLHQVSVSAIKAWNGLRSNLIWAGQKLALWKAGEKTQNVQPVESQSKTVEIIKRSSVLKGKSHVKTEEKVVKNTTSAHAPHIVRNGDTLWKIAQRYGKTVESLRKANHLPDNKLRLGQELVVE
jgi:membrane-bound lytic murein transglycosylase D